jgi:hypothetical protein
MTQLTCFKVCDVIRLLSTKIFLAGAILVSLVFCASGPMALIVLVAMGWFTRARYVVDFDTKHGIGQQASSPFDYSEGPHFMMSSGVAHGA